MKHKYLFVSLYATSNISAVQSYLSDNSFDYVTRQPGSEGLPKYIRFLNNLFRQKVINIFFSRNCCKRKKPEKNRSFLLLKPVAKPRTIQIKTTCVVEQILWELYLCYFLIKQQKNNFSRSLGHECCILNLQKVLAFFKVAGCEKETK